MFSYRWGALLLILVAVSPSRGALAGEVDVQGLLERMKSMEAKMAEQERKLATQENTIAVLRAENHTTQTTSQKVDKALSAKSHGSNVIFHDPGIHKRPIQIGGYLDVTYQYAFNQPTVPVPAYNMERIFDGADNNDFNMHLAKIFFDGTAQEAGQAGFRIDLAFGSDADLFDHVDAVTGDNFSLQQAYIDYIIPVGNGLRMKVGKFATPVGYEVMEAQDNWNATRSFNFGKAVPFTHTGIGFEYQVFENWGVSGYFVNSWDSLLDGNEGKTGIVQSNWSPVSWMSWIVTGVVGNEGNKSVVPGVDDRADEDTTYLVNTVLTFDPWKKWSFALEASWGLTENGSLNDAEDGQPAAGNYNQLGFRKTPDAEWWGVAGYMKYAFLSEWYLALRGEYFMDEGATRSQYGQLFGGRQELYSGTATLAYVPVDPFEIRLEYRYDVSSRDVFLSKQVRPGFHAMDGNFLDRTNTQDTLTVQFLYKF